MSKLFSKKSHNLIPKTQDALTPHGYFTRRLTLMDPPILFRDVTIFWVGLWSGQGKIRLPGS